MNQCHTEREQLFIDLATTLGIALEVGCPLSTRTANYSISRAKELFLDAGASTTGHERG